MKRKKIFINACLITDKPSGIGIYSVELLNELVPVLEREGYQFIVYCYDPKIIANVEHKHLKKITLGSLLDKLLKNRTVFHRHLWNTFALGFLAAKFDILYSFTSHGALFHKNQIITIHDLICLSFPQSHKDQYYYFKYFLPLLIRRSKHIITISNFTKTEVALYYSLSNKKLSVIYNGVDHLEKLGQGRHHDGWLQPKILEPFCLIVGASYPHKNIETILQVCDRMKECNVRFVIVNKPTLYFSAMQEKAASLKLKNIFFLEYIEDWQLALLYKKAKLNIYLSLYEGFGFPPAEASFFGTQSLLSNKTALSEIYGNEFEFVDPIDIDKIEEIVTRYALAQNKIEVKSYLKLKQKYNWEKTALETIAIFRSY